ncbi:hypothetical protein D0863_09719 [Hortaea werneckii]|uniref:Uncharacterized protein n=1 Tax=Hortaea werneckii TaxID=91943 RepID=A0A3M7DK88_HORWE|nr:hypothetical protein D0863_09719 [Hortaea werneckii]
MWYHWSIIVGPKVETPGSKGTMFHAMEKIALVDGKAQSSWEFQERTTSMGATRMILVRIRVGKVASMERLSSVLRSTKIKGTEPGWNCVAWVKEALESLKDDGKALGTSKIDWVSIRDTAMRYVEQKKLQHRFDGTANSGEFNHLKVATWDCLEGKEVVA